jgi:23S rRNA (cytosine1962-C5)-methyltransferase
MSAKNPRSHRPAVIPGKPVRSPNLLDQRPLASEPAGRVFIKSPTGHPLIYRKRVERVEGDPQPGDLVSVHYPPEELLGHGIYNPRAEIVVRMLRLGSEAADEAWWRSRLEQAVQLRRELLRLEESTDAYRVLHAEADGFSGVVVDRFGDVLSAEVYSLGMYQRIDALLAQLGELCGTKHTLVRLGPQIHGQEGFLTEGHNSPKLPERVTIHEFGTRFRVGFAEGHKTGFFCDQRDNRVQLAKYCEGRTVLDLCCYTGGFAIQAKRLGQASAVTAVELDEEPLALAKENANLNQVRIQFAQADVFAYMRDMLQNGRQYDVVVLDPPKLIRSRREIEEGTKKHYDLNRLAMQLVRPGGLLLSCSCAGLLEEAEFLKLLTSAARNAVVQTPGEPRLPGRSLQILAKTGAAADHPVAANCPETEYLKAYWLLVQ